MRRSNNSANSMENNNSMMNEPVVPPWQQTLFLLISTISFVNGLFILWNASPSFQLSWVATKVAILSFFVFFFKMSPPVYYILVSCLLHFFIGGSHWYQLWSMVLLWSLGLNSAVIFSVYVFPLFWPINSLPRPIGMCRTMLAAFVFNLVMFSRTKSFSSSTSDNDQTDLWWLHVEVGFGLIGQSVLFMDCYDRIVRMEVIANGS